MSDRNKSYLKEAVKSGLEKNDPVVATDCISKGLNHYSAILSKFISTVHSSDHPLVFMLLRNYAESINRNHPGTSFVADMLNHVAKTEEICIRVPIRDDDDDERTESDG